MSTGPGLGVQASHSAVSVSCIARQSFFAASHSIKLHLVYRHASKAEADDQGKWSVTQQKCRFLKVDDMWQFVDYQTYGYNMSQLAQVRNYCNF